MATAAAPLSVWIRIRPVRVLWLVGAGLAYYGSARFGYVLEFSGPVASIVWLPAGVGIAFLTLGGLSLWPAIVVADLFADHYSGLPLGTALGTTLGNTLEVVVPAWLIRRSMSRGAVLGDATQVLRLIAALVLGTAVSATIGTAAAWLGGVPNLDSITRTWRTWWLGDLIGALVVVPLALAWGRPRGPAPWRGRELEAAALVVGGGLLSEVALRSDQPVPNVLVPVLLWAAVRFGERGATLAVAVVSALAVWNTTHYHGPFIFHSITRSVLSTQAFIAVAAVTTMFLRAVVAEREELARRVASSRARIVEASDRERRRLERNLHDGAQQRLLGLAALLRSAADEVGPEEERAAALIGAAEQEARVATEELRELARGLHPTVLTDLGLAEALRGLVRRSTLPIVVRQLPEARLPETVEATAYYVTVEAVANAQKHARAGRVRLEAVVAGDRLRVEIADDGVGGAVERSGGGLEGLRDRVEAIGGRLELRSLPGRGTTITAQLPLYEASVAER
jgi:signal transduction histidine kinase